MEPYVRPLSEIASYRDRDGAPIPYGARWEDSPPESTYGVSRHPQRFAPLVEVARAVIEHLDRSYDVERVDRVVSGRDVVSLVPRSDACTAVTITLTDHDPGVALRAGHRLDTLWPVCDCDACDESVPDLVDDLEATLLTIAEGGFSEWRSGPDRSMPLVTDDDGRAIGDDHVPWQTHVRFDGRLRSESAGWSSGVPEPVELPTEPHRWARWPVRPSA